MAGTSPSLSNLGKKPRWYLTEGELLSLPSRTQGGMEVTQELKCRREAAGFIQVVLCLLLSNPNTLHYHSGNGRTVKSKCAKSQRKNVRFYFKSTLYKIFY